MVMSEKLSTPTPRGVLATSAAYFVEKGKPLLTLL
jgi:hypothetical protein